MINIPKHVGRAARAVVGAFTGSGLAQRSVTSQGEASVLPGMAELARRAAAEGCVLLENDGTLPLATTESVAVFGRCQLDWIHVGHGSGGDVNAPYLTNLIDGLDNVGATYDHVLAETYRAWCADPRHAADPGFWAHWPQSLPDMPVSAELAHAAGANARTAIVVIGRAAGEDQDLAPAPGGYYLSDDERELLSKVTDAFERTVVVLDVCNLIDLSWMDAYDGRLSAVLIAWPGGMEAGNAVADVLYGRVNPSGRLTSVVARSLDEHPSSKTFGTKGVQEYSEGVFVGFRHLYTYEPYNVRYRLGHGLSYTTFAIETLLCRRSGSDVRARFRVTNTGTRSGRDSIILWCEPPRGLIAKPLLVVAGFTKTGTLEPGASEEVELNVPLEDLATFDASRRAFVLEQGTYRFVANGTFASTGVLDEDIVFAELEPLCATSADLRTRIKAHLAQLRASAAFDDRRVSFGDVAAGLEPLDALIAQLSPAELEGLTRGAGTMNVAPGPTGNAGAFGGVTPELRKRDIPAIICADGPAGARLARPCSLLPCATALASTWDAALVEELYAFTGHEVANAGVDVLLAPGMNIQRSPLCGRNFEYFSEDPILTGHMAAAVVRGLRKAGIDACPKHFACNNQELGRNTLDARVDERTLRELYLRPFQICVREGKPRLIMTSYNKVNGVWSHYNYALVTTVLRGEWGFEGVVITDWWMRRAHSPEFPTLRDNAYRVRAGVDVLMPGNMGRIARGYRVHPSLLESLDSPDGITRAELEQCARHVLAFILQARR